MILNMFPQVDNKTRNHTPKIIDNTKFKIIIDVTISKRQPITNSKKWVFGLYAEFEPLLSTFMY